MPDYIIEGNTQAAAQGNSWQDGVNALVILWKQAIQSMHELWWTVILKNFWILIKITTQIRKSSKMCLHFGRISLKRGSIFLEKRPDTRWGGGIRGRDGKRPYFSPFFCNLPFQVYLGMNVFIFEKWGHKITDFDQPWTTGRHWYYIYQTYKV